MLTVNSLVVGLQTVVNAVVAKTLKLATVTRAYSPIISSWHFQSPSLCLGKPQFTVGERLSLDMRASMRGSRRRAHGSAVL